MNTNDKKVAAKKTSRRPRTPKVEKPKIEQPKVNEAVETVRQSTVLEDWAMPGRPKSKPHGLPKLTDKQVLSLLEERDRFGAEHGENDVELVLAGYIERSSLDLLDTPDDQVDTVFNTEAGSQVPLWHPHNPPSRALIPVFVLPEELEGVVPQTVDYQGYADPDDIQGGHPDDEDNGPEISNLMDECHRLTNNNNYLIERNNELENDINRLILARTQPTLIQRLKAFYQDKIRRQTYLSVDEARLRPTFFVVNTLKDSDRKLHGEVLIPYEGMRSNTKMYRLPDTWLPLEPNEYERGYLLQSPAFHTALDEGLVKLMSASVALATMDHPKAKEEHKRFTEMEERVREAGRMRTVSIHSEVFPADPSRHDEDN
jgi:hypothetical protein